MGMVMCMVIGMARCKRVPGGCEIVLEQEEDDRAEADAWAWVWTWALVWAWAYVIVREPGGGGAGTFCRNMVMGMGNGWL